MAKLAGTRRVNAQAKIQSNRGDFMWKITPIFISVCAASIACYVGWLQRDTAKRNNKPYLGAHFYFNDSGSGFQLLNFGVGAAYLHWFQILVDNQAYSSANEIAKNLGLEDNQKIGFDHPAAVMPSGSKAVLLWAPPGAGDQQLRKNFNRVSFKMCYCSVFDDCWSRANYQAPKEVDTCEPLPKPRYGGFPEPASPW